MKILLHFYISPLPSYDTCTCHTPAFVIDNIHSNIWPARVWWKTVWFGVYYTPVFYCIVNNSP